MSDGLSDASAVGKIAGRLEEAAYQLRDALKAVEEGHRGLTVANPEAQVNRILEEQGYRIYKWRK